MTDDVVNIKRILMNLRWEIINHGIEISPSRRYINGEVYIPSFSSRVKIYYKDDYIFVKINKHIYKLKPVFEEGKISEDIINAIVGLIKYHKAESKIRF